MPLVKKRTGRIGKEPLQVQQQHSPFPAIAPEVPVKLFLQAAIMPMKALALLACPVVIDHAGVIQGNQNFIAKGFVDLAVSDMGRIYGAYLAPLSKCEMGTLHRLSILFQYLLPPFCRTGKQVAFKVLNTLLPPYPVTAFPAIEEHLAETENFVHRPKAITPGLFLCLPLGFAALVSRFMPFLACHKNKVFAFRTDKL